MSDIQLFLGLVAVGSAMAAAGYGIAYFASQHQPRLKPLRISIQDAGEKRRV